MKPSLNRLSARDADGITGHELAKHDVFELDIVKHVYSLIDSDTHMCAEREDLHLALILKPNLLLGTCW